MNPVCKAVWHLENALPKGISLEEAAQWAGVTPYHLTRSFALAMGVPFARYARGRRLSEAAKLLATGSSGILGVALEAGYGSHEAFTRAFRDQFGITPDRVRSPDALQNLKLVEPLPMNTSQTSPLPPIRFENGPEMLLAGISAHYRYNDTGGLPGQWQRFAGRLHELGASAATQQYGVTLNYDPEGTFDYVCAAPIASPEKLPEGMVLIRLKPQRYAVFAHRGHVAEIASTWQGIWSWLPESGQQPLEAPAFERYDERFDSMTGQGGFEVWVPVANAAG